jgi:hypothetical protein
MIFKFEICFAAVATHESVPSPIGIVTVSGCCSKISQAIVAGPAGKSGSLASLRRMHSLWHIETPLRMHLPVDGALLQPPHLTRNVGALHGLEEKSAPSIQQLCRVATAAP